MKKREAVSWMRGQDQTPEKQLNEVKVGNLEKEFRMTVNMVQDLGKRMEDLQS